MGGPEPVYFCISSENFPFLLRKKDHYLQHYITNFLFFFLFLMKLSKTERNIFFSLWKIHKAQEKVSEINKTLESTFLFYNRGSASSWLISLNDFSIALYL